jgi:2-dehydropantoate 2-reductase
MRIGIIGGGSTGLLYAYYLNQTFSVTIYTRTTLQAEKINAEGLFLKKGEQLSNLFVKAVPFDNWKGKEEITIVTVKQYQLENVLLKLQNKDIKGSTFLFLQNGMGHIKHLDKLSAKNILVGSIEHGAYRNSPNMVTHNGEGVTRVAIFRGQQEFLNDFVDAVPSSFPIVIEPDYYEMLVRKLIVNAVINPMTAILRIQNGELINNPHYYEIFQNVFSEIIEILNLKNKDDYFNNLIQVCEKTAQNRSSMLKDLESNRETEVDAILGFLLAKAEKDHIHSPLIRTFYQLIKGKEWEGING